MADAARCGETTKAGRPCRNWAVEGSVPPMCSSHLGHTGPPRRDLDPQLVQRLVAAVASGTHLLTALSALGVPQSSYYDWIDRGNPDGRAPEDEPYRDLRVRMERAKDEGVTELVGRVKQAAAKDWRAAAWLLERTEPERFARAAVARSAAAGDDPAPAAGAQAGEDADPFAALPGDELAAARARRDAG